MSTELHQILAEFGALPGFSTCECAHCFGMREVERRITSRQAFHTVMGADLFESMAADMPMHWVIVAAIAAPKVPETSPAYLAICAISKADADIEYTPIPNVSTKEQA